MMEYKVKGEWKKVGDLDTTGGALEITQPDGKIIQNPKWCQNPQFHLELQNPNGKDEIYLKVVLQRTDKGALKGGQSQKNVKDSDGKGKDATCGIVITKAEILVEDPSKPKKKSSKYNRFGEVISTKCIINRLFFNIFIANFTERIIFKETKRSRRRGSCKETTRKNHSKEVKCRFIIVPPIIRI